MVGASAGVKESRAGVGLTCAPPGALREPSAKAQGAARVQPSMPRS